MRSNTWLFRPVPLALLEKRFNNRANVIDLMIDKRFDFTVIVS